MDQFNIYYEFLIQENAKYNLTAITDHKEVEIKHFEDSLSVGEALDFGAITTICDVGSGAGFPGIPLKIKYPHIKLTIIEPTTKKCTFLHELVLKCDLKDVIIINDRAENCKAQRDLFDCVTSRAVGAMPMLAELCLPLVKKGGYFIAMKGPDYEEDLKQATRAFKMLGAEVEAIIPIQLRDNMGKRTLIKIRKVTSTPVIYPRAFAIIKKKPL